MKYEDPYEVAKHAQEHLMHEKFAAIIKDALEEIKDAAADIEKEYQKLITKSQLIDTLREDSEVWYD